MITIPVASRAGRHMQAFLGSSVSILCLNGLAGVSLYPRMLPSSTDLSFSLTAYNASSTPRTLTVMLVIALIGMPSVIGYTAFVCRVFKRKVIIGEESYRNVMAHLYSEKVRISELLFFIANATAVIYSHHHSSF